MKKLIYLIGASLLIAGCTIPTQTVEYNTIGALEATAVSTYSGYCTYSFSNTNAAANLPKVSEAFNQCQSDLALAASLSQLGTNVLATTNLVIEVGQLTSVITTLEPLVNSTNK